MKRNIILSLIFVFTLVIAMGCQNKQETQVLNSARVIFAIGEVQVKESDTWGNAIENMILYQGNEIKTGPNAQCNIVIGKDSYISIKEKSHLLLDSLLKSKEEKEENTVTLKLGKSVVNPKKLLKGESFRVKTPTAIAAVRGTKFVVESNPEGKMKVAVVDGKVELKRRIPALEEVEEKLIKKSEALTSLKEKVEIEKIVVDANESAFIDNKKAEHENKVIKQVIEKHVSEIEEVSAIETVQKKETPETVEIQKENAEKLESFKKKDEKVKDELANLLIMKKKEKEVVQIKLEPKIETVDVKAVKELDTVIEEVKVKEEEEAKKAAVEEKKPEEITELTITSPVKKSAIYINSKFKGYDTITLRPEADKELNIKVTAYGYDDFVDDVKLKKGKKKEITVKMQESPKLTIASPVKNSRIYVNNKFVGTDNVTVPVKSGMNAQIMVRARGFKAYSTEVQLRRNQEKTINADMIRIYALERVKWIKDIKSKLRVKPIYYQSKLILATHDGLLIATDRSGKKVWQIDLKRRIESTPLLRKGIIYVVNNSGDFYAIDVSSGDIKWKIKIDGSLLFGAQPVIAQDVIYLGTSFGRVYALKLNGKELWQVDLENGIYSSVVYNKGTLFVGAEDRNVYALDTGKKGKIKWIYQVDGRMVSSAPVVDSGNLYVGCYSGSFYALDASRGKLKWSFKTGDAIISSPVVKGDNIYFGSNDGYFYALKKSTGKTAWKVKTIDKVENGAAVSNNYIFFSSGNRMYALDLNTGAEQWTHDFKQPVKTSGTVIGNDIIVGLDDGHLASVRNSLTSSFD